MKRINYDLIDYYLNNFFDRFVKFSSPQFCVLIFNYLILTDFTLPVITEKNRQFVHACMH